MLVGRTDQMGWGLTTANLDDQDIVIEKLNPENPEEYALPDGSWAKFDSRQTIVTVKDSEPVTLTLRWSRNGPILSGNQFDVGTVTPPGHVAALSWTALSGADTSMTAAMQLMKAGTVADAMEAGRLHVAPAQNLVLAGPDGIALQVTGLMPGRDPGTPARAASRRRAGWPRWGSRTPCPMRRTRAS